MEEAEPKSIDVLVVGGGPAGCAAAASAALGGASVLLVDAKAEIGLPVRCAEFVPRLMAREVEISDDAIAQAVDGMTVYVSESGGDLGDAVGSIRSPGFIIHREKIERRLAAAAVDAGAQLLMSTRATPSPDGTVVLSGEKSYARFAPRVVVSAEGPRPTLRASTDPRKCLPAIQYTLPITERRNEVTVHFSREFRMGYAWVFPKGDVANVGLGCAPKEGRGRLVSLLNEFVSELAEAGMIAGTTPRRRTAGWIPIWGPAETARERNVLFVGDAAGFTDPITGAGIWPAIATGRSAGECAARAVEAGDLSVLNTYDEQWRELFYHPLRRAAQARERMEREWDGPDFTALVRDFWPGL